MMINKDEWNKVFAAAGIHLGFRDCVVREKNVFVFIAEPVGDGEYFKYARGYYYEFLPCIAVLLICVACANDTLGYIMTARGGCCYVKRKH